MNKKLAKRMTSAAQRSWENGARIQIGGSMNERCIVCSIREGDDPKGRFNFISEAELNIQECLRALLEHTTDSEEFKTAVKAALKPLQELNEEFEEEQMVIKPPVYSTKKVEGDGHQKVKITIKGGAGSGKSTLLHGIGKALQEKGFNVKCIDDHGSDDSYTVEPDGFHFMPVIVQDEITIRAKSNN